MVSEDVACGVGGMVSEDVACGVGGAWRMSMRCCRKGLWVRKAVGGSSGSLSARCDQWRLDSLPD